MLKLDDIKRQKPRKTITGPDRCPRLDGQFGGMKHHGPGEPTTREMPPWHERPEPA